MVPTSWAMDDIAHTHRPFINCFPHSGQLRISMISWVVKLPSSSSTLTLNIPCLFTAISMPLYSTAWFIGTKSFVPDSQYGHLIELTFHCVFEIAYPPWFIWIKGNENGVTTIFFMVQFHSPNVVLQGHCIRTADKANTFTGGQPLCPFRVGCNFVHKTAFHAFQHFCSSSHRSTFLGLSIL